MTSKIMPKYDGNSCVPLSMLKINLFLLVCGYPCSISRVGWLLIIWGEMKLQEINIESK